VPGYAAALPGEEVPVAVVIDIPEGHRIYEESVEINVAPGTGGSVDSLTKPAAVTKYDPVLGRPKAVYVGRAVFRLAVEAPEPLSVTMLGEDGREHEVRSDDVRIRLRVRFQGCSESVCFLPETRELAVELPRRREGEQVRLVNQELFAAASAEERGTPPAEEGFAGRNLAVALLFSFGFGVLLSFTPCVYPLIPVTIAVIGASGGGAGRRKGFALSVVYVFGLSVTYAVLGVIAATGGARLGAVAGHWITATVIAALFCALAFSLFGVYDLELPPSWQARLRIRRGGGPAGVLLMGMLSGLVASPCIAAPIASVLIYIAKTGNVLRGGLMLFVMGWGIGAILIVAGTFSGLMSKLPKAGGWMLAVKTGLGVVLVAAAAYFARASLPPWVFTAWTAAPLFGFGLAFGAWMRAGPDSSQRRLLLRAFGLVALVFGLYLGVGAMIRGGMPAPVLSGLYPASTVPSAVDFREDYQEALEDARAEGRPVMIDFVSDNCPACVELANEILSREDVAREAERFVVVRVNVDRSTAPEEELDRLRVLGTPTVVWIDSAGDVRYDLTVTGADISPGEFLRRMREVR
jgi:thiol:disulfide interchange protein DsbD